MTEQMNYSTYGRPRIHRDRGNRRRINNNPNNNTARAVVDNTKKKNNNNNNNSHQAFDTRMNRSAEDGSGLYYIPRREQQLQQQQQRSRSTEANTRQSPGSRPRSATPRRREDPPTGGGAGGSVGVVNNGGVQQRQRGRRQHNQQQQQQQRRYTQTTTTDNNIMHLPGDDSVSIQRRGSIATPTLTKSPPRPRSRPSCSPAGVPLRGPSTSRSPARPSSSSLNKEEDDELDWARAAAATATRDIRGHHRRPYYSRSPSSAAAHSRKHHHNPPPPFSARSRSRTPTKSSHSKQQKQQQRQQRQYNNTSSTRITLTRSQSWDGRTKHYDPKKVKDYYNDDHHDDDDDDDEEYYEDDKDEDETAAKILTKQMSGFDLHNSGNSNNTNNNISNSSNNKMVAMNGNNGNTNERRRQRRNSIESCSSMQQRRSRSASLKRRGSSLGRRSLGSISSISISRRRRRSNKRSASTTASTSYSSKRRVAKEFLKERVVPFMTMPVISGSSCRKRSQSRSSRRRIKKDNKKKQQAHGKGKGGKNKKKKKVDAIKARGMAQDCGMFDQSWREEEEEEGGATTDGSATFYSSDGDCSYSSAASSYYSSEEEEEGSCYESETSCDGSYVDKHSDHEGGKLSDDDDDDDGSCADIDDESYSSEESWVSVSGSARSRRSNRSASRSVRSSGARSLHNSARSIHSNRSVRSQRSIATARSVHSHQSSHSHKSAARSFSSYEDAEQILLNHSSSSSGSSPRSKSRSHLKESDDEDSEDSDGSEEDSYLGTQSSRGRIGSRSHGSSSRSIPSARAVRSRRNNGGRRRPDPDGVSESESEYEYESEDEDDESTDSSRRGVHQGNRTSQNSKQLIHLLKENDQLRASMSALRNDFETMLRQMNSLDDGNANDNGNGNNNHQTDDGEGASISTDDDSRISHSLREINNVKSLTTEKLQEKKKEEERLRVLGNTARKGKSDDLQSYEECIDDLLLENEHLYDKVATLTREREEVVKEVCDLRCSENGTPPAIKNDTTASASASAHDPVSQSIASASSAGEDGSVSVGGQASFLLDDISKLTSGMGQQDDIMQLVSKILTQRKRVDPSTPRTSNKPEVVLPSTPRTPLSTKPPEVATPISTPGEAKVARDEMKKKGEQEDMKEELITANDSTPSSPLKDQTQMDLKLEDFLERHSPHNQAKNESNEVSTRTVLYKKSSGSSDESSSCCDEEYLISNNELDVSSNSLFDTAPSVNRPSLANDKHASALSVVEEYIAEAAALRRRSSDEEGYCSKDVDLYHEDCNGENDSHSYSSEEEGYFSLNEEIETANYQNTPDEEIETTNYHAYSPSPGALSSNYSRSSRGRSSAQSSTKHSSGRSRTSTSRSRAPRANSPARSSSRSRASRGYSPARSTSRSRASRTIRSSSRNSSRHSGPSEKDHTSSEESLATLVDRYGTRKNSFHSHYSSHGPLSSMPEQSSNCSPKLPPLSSGKQSFHSHRSSRARSSRSEGRCSKATTAILADEDDSLIAKTSSYNSCQKVNDKPRESDNTPEEEEQDNTSNPRITTDSVGASAESLVHDVESHQSSIGGGSTREAKGICLTVISRASPHVHFPSSVAHTYVTFFNAKLTKDRIDDVMTAQFREEAQDAEDEVMLDSMLTSQQRQSSDARHQQLKKKKKYQGEYNQDGQRHGYGIYTSRNGNEYRGEWQHGKREGLGVVNIGNGDAFEGQFERNLKNGVGVYHYKDGECDLSLYKDDRRVGESVRYSKDRRRAYLLAEDGHGGSFSAITLDEGSSVAKGMGTIVAHV